MKRILSISLAFVLLLSCTLITPPTSVSAGVNQVTTGTITPTNSAQSELLNDLMEQYTSFIVVKHKQLGGSHYSYTEAVSDSYDSGAPNGDETPFNPGSQLVLVELEKSGNNVKRTETVLIESTTGVIRDPDVSEDATRVLFSWKKTEKSDDYHLYEYDLITRKTRQLTFGLGVADTEPKYLPNGNIVFSSTRCIQTVDCWKTPVANLFICGPNGEDIVRVGYDQVHTSYPTVTDDGRVLYTRWDYNDRTQMFVQGVFQMFPDGTNQTELFGNNSNFPTTLLHTRKVAGTSDKYIAIASGHHTRQMGKLVILDTSVGRNDPDAVTMVFPDEHHDKWTSVDWYGQGGAMYKYPYSISETQFLVSCAMNGRIDNNEASTPFSIYLMDMDGTRVELVPGNQTYPASQIVPITTRTLFERASMVNYSSNTGTYYIGNIYEGDGLKGVEVGTAKYLRIVALDYRSYAIGDTFASGNDIGTGTADPYTPISTGNGSWDVKRVLGIVPIEEDGSALFKVPSETPIYFQVLDEEGQMIQSMRSWSTLMPGETFSCVGCHEDKNTVPPASATTTMAMAKGVQEIQPDFWQTGEGYEDFDPYTTTKGFDYLDEIQPIWDENCVRCHNDSLVSYDMIDAYDMDGAVRSMEGVKTYEPIAAGSNWQYYKSNRASDVPDNWNTIDFRGNWDTGKAPFGNDENIGYNTLWNDTSYIWLRQEFEIKDLSDYENVTAMLSVYYDDIPNVYINGHQVYSADKWCGGSYVASKIENVEQYLLKGTNVMTVRCEDTGGGRMIDANMLFVWTQAEEKESVTILDREADNYSYVINQKPADNWMEPDFDDSAWKVGQAGFGDRGAQHTDWSGNESSIWLRKDISISQEQYDKIKEFNMRLSLDIFYDDDSVVYLNGKEIFSAEGWVDEYTTVELSKDVTDLLKVGTNVLAIHTLNSDGGAFIDAALMATESSYDNDIAGLEGLKMYEPITAGSNWQYYKSNNTSDVPDNWNTLNFSGNWETAKAPFGNDQNLGYNTLWNDNDYIWLRQKFEIENLSDYKNVTALLNIYYDDIPIVYINGHQVFTANDWCQGSYVTAKIENVERYLRKGTNVMSIRCQDKGGGRMIDSNLLLVWMQGQEKESDDNDNDNDVVGSESSLEGLEMYEPITVGSNWQYYKSNNTSDVPDNWNTLNFSGNWENGKAPFGSDKNLGYNTLWNDTDYIWLRQEFEIENLSDYKNVVALLSVYHDDIPIVYINGHQVFTANDWCQGSYVTAKIENVDQYLLKGTNVMTIRCENTGGERMIDSNLLFVWMEGQTKESMTILDREADNYSYVIDQKPADNWMEPDFDDSAWKVGQGGFGDRGGQHTEWAGNKSSIWLRKDINISQEQLDKIKKLNMRLSLDIFYDDDSVVYLNGKEIFSADGWVDEYTTIELFKDVTDLLKVGTNVLAINTLNSDGGAFIDAALMATESSHDNDMDGAESGLEGLKMYEPITAGSKWQYHKSNETSDVPNNWNTIDFSGNWDTAQAPFGSDKNLGYNTLWNDTDYIWLRQEFEIENLSDYKNVTAMLNVYHDDIPIVYINGHQVFTANDWCQGNYVTAKIENVDQYLLKGTNVMTIRCENTGGERMIDAKLLFVWTHGQEKESDDNDNDNDVVVAENSLEGLNMYEPITAGSKWQYKKSNNASDVPDNWNTIDFSGNWDTAQAPFGSDQNLGYNTLWNDTSYIWLRQEFEIEDLSDYKNVTAMLNIYYDDIPIVYINGHQVFTADNWCQGSYVTAKIENVDQYLLKGTNVVTIRCQDTGGGRMIDANMLFIWKYVNVKDSITILDREADNYSYVINQKPADNWMEPNFDDSAWKVGQGGFGDRGGQHTNWSGGESTIWLRKDINISQEQFDNIKELNMRLSLDIFYDENPVIYLNGEEILSARGWVDDYTTIYLPKNATDLLKVGTNVLAIRTSNAGGGSFIDVALKATKSFSMDFSLESAGIISPQMKKAFPLSYLVLTGSKPSGREPEWLGDADNDFINWISCMSQCEMLDPYQYGSTQSNLITMLKEKHQGVELTDVQLRKIMAWIDLSVPCYGDYSSGNTWDANAQRWADECDTKRAYYVSMNELARKSRALGAEAVAQDISITYRTGNTVYDNAVNFPGAKRLELPTNYKAGDIITVTLPKGEQYLGLTLDNRMGEAIIYVPNGTYTFTVPSDLRPYNRTFKNNNAKTITARVVSMDELNERRNLAKNPYDLTALNGSSNPTGGYPHAITNSNYGNSGEFVVRNAIDGVTANKGHGSYPTQSWGPDQGAGKWMQVDFGREVYLDEVVLAIRADFPHDTYFKSGTLEFSDGTTVNINIEKTADKQSFTFEPIKTSYVKLTNLVAVDVNGDDWAAITEFEAYGTFSK